MFGGFSFRSSRNASIVDNASPGALANTLGELNCNSPGALRQHRGKRSARQHSPYGGRRSNRLLGGSLLGSNFESSDDGRMLLTPGRQNSSSFVADKHVTLKKGDGEMGLKLVTDDKLGVVVSGVDLEGQATKNGVLVGDIITAIDGLPVSTHQEANKILDHAAHGRKLTLTAPASSRLVRMNKTMGDLGMTCSAATHATRGVLLKRIQKGSLADKAELYCGDTIISVNEQLVNTHSQAVKIMNEIKTEVRLVMWGKSTEVTLEKHGPLGITLANHDDPTDGPGVKVVAVDFDGRCAKAGLSNGDTLMSVNSVLCTDHAQALALLEQKQMGADDATKVVFMDKYSH